MTTLSNQRSDVRPFVLVVLTILLFGLIAWINRPDSDLQAYKKAGLPFGCIPSPGEGYAVQDFGYNLLYFRGIQNRLVAHPYRQVDQEKLIHHWLPTAASGMCHAYSPVAFVLAQPLLLMPASKAYVLYLILSAAGLLLLYHVCLLPLAESRLQIGLLIICLLNITVATAFDVGQSALVTTSLLGFLWYYLQRRVASRLTWKDGLLALLFWALCMKPSIAMIPLTLLIGARAWSALAISGALLAATWIALGPLYGGWWNGLQDYSFLLNHYYKDAMIPFMQDVFNRHGDTGANAFFSTLYPDHSPLFFTVSRILYLFVSLILLGLRLADRLTPSAQFQGMIWNFLLLCPYLLPAEDCIFCLLIVDGSFFKPSSLLVDGAKVLFVLAIMNLRSGLTYPGQINFPLKCILLAWIIGAAFRAASTRKNAIEAGSKMQIAR